MRFWGAKPSPTALQAAKGETLRYTGKNVEERQTTKNDRLSHLGVYAVRVV